MARIDAPILTPRPDEPRPTCWYCQKPLRSLYDYDWPLESLDPVARHFAGYGARGTGHFCTLEHGFLFAVEYLRRQRTL